MTLVTNEECSLANDTVRFFVTYDDSTMRVSSVRIENDWTGAVRITATQGGTVLSYVAQPGEHTTQTLANNQHYFYDQWTITMGAA